MVVFNKITVVLFVLCAANREENMIHVFLALDLA